MDNFDRRQLRYFVAVAEELHFGNAARRLHISQPPLSQQIAALEDDLRVQLFVRTKRKVEITPAGQQFLRDARLILGDMVKAGAQARAAAEGQTGVLNIGLNYSTPISPIFSKIFRRFAKLYPNVGLELHENTSAKQLDGLYHRTLDLCFIWPTRDDASPDIGLQLIGDDELHFVASNEHRELRKTRLNVNDLKDHTIFLTLRQTRIDFYDALVKACHKKGFEPDIRTDVIQMPFIMNIAATGKGITFIPSFFSRLKPEGAFFRTFDFLPRDARRMPLAIAYRAKDTSPLIANFIRAAQAV